MNLAIELINPSLIGEELLAEATRAAFPVADLADLLRLGLHIDLALLEPA